MFGIFEDLAKATLAAVATPVALAVDVVKLPITASDLKAGPFDNTEKMLKAVSDNINNAISPNK